MDRARRKTWGRGNAQIDGPTRADRSRFGAAQTVWQLAPYSCRGNHPVVILPLSVGFCCYWDG